MKRSLILLCLLGIQLILPAQGFNTYFYPKTLRINYIHSGTKDKDSIEVKNYQVDNLWAGSLTNLIDPNDYGCHKIMVYDVNSKQLIYSRTYSCLFGVYKTTEKGATLSKAFQETERCPYPKNSVRIEFYTRNQYSDFEKRQEIVVHPKTIQAVPNTYQCEVMDLHIGGNYNQAYDLVIVPEGYALEDSTQLREDLMRCKNAIIECTPFKESAVKINIRAVLSYSEDSGISVEIRGKKVKTVVGSAFYSLDLERYLMLDHVWQLHNVCSNAPYDNIIILCNTKKYGGGGIYNWYATVSNNKHFNYVCVHELGHTIGGLADEYYTSEVTVQDFYPKGSEPKEPNITSLVNFESKWKNMLAPNTPIPTLITDQNNDLLGVYEGAGYCAKGLYRPYISCTMKDIVYNKFCPVCQKALIEMFDFYAK